MATCNIAVYCDGEIPRENPGCPIAHHNLPIDLDLKLRMKIGCGRVPMPWHNGSSFLIFFNRFRWHPEIVLLLLFAAAAAHRQNNNINKSIECCPKNAQESCKHFQQGSISQTHFVILFFVWRRRW